MGLFGKRATNAAEIGRFHTRHQLDAVLGVAYAGVADQLTQAAPEVRTPGVLESIYLSRYGADGLTVTAGNAVETYFSFLVDLTQTSAGTEGHVYFDRPPSDVRRWMGNTIHLRFGLQAALEGASVTVTEWRTKS
ncbi:MAG: hypothetical protein ABW215_17030 [Kibdelosporangium sp.]